MPEVIIPAPNAQRGESRRIDANRVAFAFARCFET